MSRFNWLCRGLVDVHVGRVLEFRGWWTEFWSSTVRSNSHCWRRISAEKLWCQCQEWADVSNNNNAYFPICEIHAQGKIKFVFGWCIGNVNNENRKGYGDICYVASFGRRDRNLQSKKWCTYIRDKIQNCTICFASLFRIFWNCLWATDCNPFSASLHQVGVVSSTVEKSSVADVKIWPEEQTSTALLEGQKSHVEGIKVNEIW